MAFIVKRGKAYSVIYYIGTGKDRRQVWKSGLSYSAAKAEKRRIEREVESEASCSATDISVKDFLLEFITKYGEKKWVASTYDGNVGLIHNYVIPYMGEMPLRSVRTKTIDDFYDYLLDEAEPVAHMGRPKREKIAPSVIRDIHKVMRCAFNQAKKWEYITKNPFLNATVPEYKEKQRDALTPDQLHRILQYTDDPSNYTLYMMHCAIQLGFACCLRGGEIGAIQWERYDQEQQIIRIDRVVDRVKKELLDKLTKMEIYYKFPTLYPGTRTVIVLKQPKTKGAVRNVYIPDTVAKELLVLRKMQIKLHNELGDDGYTDYGLMICQENGRPVMTEFLNKTFKEILQQINDPTINIDNVVFHSIRHASATIKLKLSQGDLKSVQGDGGWSSTAMLTKRYTHIIDDDRRHLAEQMEATFYQGSTAPGAGEMPNEAAMQAALQYLTNHPDLIAKVLASASQTTVN